MMGEHLTIYGASDDLIEFRGAIEEEFGAYDLEGGVLAISDGTLIHAEYDEEGTWRFRRIAEGASKCEHRPACGDEGNREDGTPNYSDSITLSGGPPIKWIVLGTQKVILR